MFILENLFITLLVLIGIGITVVAATRYLEEYGLNKQLRLKQRSMRIKGEVVTSKKSLLGALVLAPTFIVVLGIFVAANIGSGDIGQLITVKSSDDILQIFEKYQDQTNTYNSGWFRNGDFSEALAGIGNPEADFDDAVDDGTGSDDYSGPNNQVQGVDEMDNVVTDGKYIYTMHGAAIQITLAYTVENGIDNFGLAHEITYVQDFDSCESKALYPQGMYASSQDDYLVVIASEYNNYNWDCLEDGEYINWYDRNNSNSVKVFVYDKENDFELIEEYTLNGYFTGTRKIGDDLYVITNKYIPFEQEDINIDDYLPYYEVNNQKTITSYDDIIYNEGTSPNTFTTFYGIDLSKAKVDMEVVLGDNGYNLYVSNENMYLVGNVYYFFGTDTFFTDPVYENRTAIMKVSIDNAEVEFKAVGYVEGHTLDQFSMDEHDGYLRITTTTGWWGEDINNRLWVLDENLKQVSVLEHLGKPGETIRSTRFSGDYGYVVTFEQTDPFYVINLSDPTNPVKEGELEIPGFSSYLQPLNNDFMLGIGFSADGEGRIDGMKLDIYDIRDKSNPLLWDSAEFKYADFGWVWSSVTYNHKDLLIDLNKGIIAFPFSSNDYSEEEGYTYKSGIMMYEIDLEDGFSDDYSFIQHEENSDEYVYVYKAQFIDDYLYTISNKYVGVSLIADPEVIIKTQKVLRADNYYYWYGEGIIWD